MANTSLKEAIHIKEFTCIKAGHNFFKKVFWGITYIPVMSLTFQPYDPCLRQCQNHAVQVEWKEGRREIVPEVDSALLFTKPYVDG